MSAQSEQWNDRYNAERERLLQALGKVGEGGILEAIQHVGATSVPYLYGSDCVDIGLAVTPFPLSPESASRLEALGYHPVPGYEAEPEQRFLHDSNAYQLFVVESGNRRWTDLVLLRDYLRDDSAARDDLSLKKRNVAAGPAQLFEDVLPAAHRWWIRQYQFSPVESVAHELKDASMLWYISGGWALDLFLGKVSRVHHDVDVVVSRSAQMDLQQHMTRRGWTLVTPFEKRLEPWPPHMELQAPRHQVHAHRGDDFIDFLITDMNQVWIYRREPSVVRSLEKMGLSTEGGIPYLAPELVLLFKSKNTSNRERPNDDADFERALPHLDAERRAWLRWALTATAPQHPWIQKLS
jgi:GrpB-like predicted nucleotidyltransferase (UPF0157 family)